MSISLSKITADGNIDMNAEILANIMIAAWRGGFCGILEDSIIEKYTEFSCVKAMFSQLLASGTGTMYLSQLYGQPAGLLYWLEENGNARIEALLTIPEAWGKGVGAALMEQALANIAATGHSSVHVWPFTENHRARRFYEKQGFRPTGLTRTGDALETEYVYFF